MYCSIPPNKRVAQAENTVCTGFGFRFEMALRRFDFTRQECGASCRALRLPHAPRPRRRYA